MLSNESTKDSRITNTEVGFVAELDEIFSTEQIYVTIYSTI